MRVLHRDGRGLLAVAVLVGLVAVVVTALVPAGASVGGGGGSERGRRDVAAWIDRHAVPLRSTDPGDPVGELRPLGRIVGRASVVGLGESTHGSHEQFRLKHRMVRFLVERRGFRTVALEDDFASGVLIDRYVVTGQGDPRQLVSSMSSPFWATAEILDLVEWMRSYNQTHDHDLRFLGTDLLQLRQLSFDELTTYVGRVAPQRLEELASYLHPLRPRPDQFQWYDELSDPDQQTLIDSARRAVELVEGLPSPDHPDDPVDRAYAEQHARAIHGWYVNYAEDTGFRGHREEFIADSIQWWQHLTGDKVAYWAANAHTSAAPMLSFRNPWEEQTGTMAGGHLEQRLGRRYVSVGLQFYEGTISSDWNHPATHQIGPPPDHLLEATLAAGSPPTYLLDLRRRAPRPVRHWLSNEANMRMILPSYVTGQDGAAYTMTVPELDQAFDAVVFVNHTTASHLLTS